MSIAALNWAKRQKTGSAARKAVLMALADYADEEGCCSEPQTTIADATELTVRAVRYALADLEVAGLIRREAQFFPGGARGPSLVHLLMAEGAA